MDFYEQMLSRARGWTLPVVILFGLGMLMSIISFQGVESLLVIVFYGGIFAILLIYWLQLGKAKNNDDIEALEKATSMQSIYLILMGILSMLFIIGMVFAMLMPAMMG